MRTISPLTRLKSRPKMQPPLTPMIDVTFQLLLFFLTATTWRQAEGQIPGSLPDPDRRLSRQSVQELIKPVFIYVRPDDEGHVVFDVSGLTFAQPEALQEHLAGLRTALGSDEVPVVIAPQWNVPWQHVVEVYNQVLRSQFKRVSLAPSY